MNMQVDVDVKMERLKKALDNFAYNDVKKATRYAINRSLLTMRTTAVQAIRQNLNLKVRAMQSDRSKYMRVIKAKPSDTLSEMFGSLSFSDHSISMMEFVVGSKDIKSQKGIAVKNRRRIHVKVKPGKSTYLKRAFLQKGPRSSRVEVFVRRRAGGFKVLKVNSLASRVTNGGILPRVQLVGERRFRELFFAYLRQNQSNYDGRRG